MNDDTYDVVIVGAGIAGAIIAKTVSDAGYRVLILEAGLGVNSIDLDGEAAREVYQEYLDTFYMAQSKVPNAPYPDLPAAPSPSVLDIRPIKSTTPSTEGYFVQAGPLPFGSDYARTPGGTTLHWLGTCLRMLPNDFRMKSKYGVGVDWPISYDELRPYYEMAEREIGVSADVEDLHYPNAGPNFFGHDYVFPMHGIPQSYLDHQFTKAVSGLTIAVDDGAGGVKQVPVRVTPVPQGRNSTPNEKYTTKGLRWDPATEKLFSDRHERDDHYEPVGAIWDPYTGQRCEGNASCEPICPVQAKYNALKTLKSAKNRVTIIPRAVAFKVEVAGTGEITGQPVTGIKYKRYHDATGKDYEVRTARGNRYVLAAHAVENAKLLLASGIANSSDQVGRNLMDHVTLLTWGLMPEPVYGFRGPSVTSSLSDFRDHEFRKDHASFVVPINNWGWQWATGSPTTDLNHAVDQQRLFGSSLRRYAEDTLTRQVLLHFECEQLPEATNRVTIADRYRDSLGNHRPVIQYDISIYLRKAFAAAKGISDQLFAHAGVEDHSFYDPGGAQYFTYGGQGYVYSGAGHCGGTHRMGSNPEDSVVDRDQRTWDHDNLFLVGCGNMATMGTSNPTLTMAALSFWAAENILKDLGKSGRP